MTDLHHQWPIAKRAGKACLGCRARKVKCDFEHRGLPCTNCALDGGDCRVQKSKRGRKPFKKDATLNSGQAEAALHSTHSSFDRFSHGHSRPESSRMHTTQWLLEPEKRVLNGVLNENSYGPGVLEDRKVYNLLEMVDRNTLDRLHNEVTWASLMDHDRVTDLYKNSSSPSTSSQHSPQTISDSLPVFVKPIPSHLNSEDIDYLIRKGVFSFPSSTFVEALIRCYIRYFHPLMPLLDLPTLLCCLSGHGSHCSPKISILLLQAVLFTGASFVDLAELQNAGFSSRRAARRTLYDRARVLYDLDVECDRIPVIQTALLLSYWAEAPGDNKGGWHWTGICHTLALTLGLHRESDSTLPARHIHLRKRIWWSFYIRDRLIALGMSRPLRIKDDEFNTPMLTVEDFDLDDSVTDGIHDFSLTREHQKASAEMCIKMVELSVIIGKVVNLHFSLIPSRESAQHIKDYTGRTTPILLPNFQMDQIQSIMLLDRDLQTWNKTRPLSTIFQPTTVDDCAMSTPSTLTVHQAFLQFSFFSTVSALYRHLINRRSTSTDKLPPNFLQMSSKRIEEAGVELAAVNRKLDNLDFAGFLHPTVATMELPVIITHIKRIQHRHRDTVLQALQSILYCLKVLQKMQDMYHGVDLVISFALDVMKRAGIELHAESDQGPVEVRYGDCSYSITSENNLDRPRDLEVQRDSPGFVFLGMPATTKHNSIMSSSQERHPSSTLSDLPEPQWNSQSDIFLTDTMDFDPAFSLMCEFETLGYREIGRLSHT